MKFKKYNEVSVILPVHNGEKTLSKSIESVLNQTMKNFELIILNHCSTDRTYEIAKDYSEKEKNIRLYNYNNIGFGFMKNDIMRLSNSDWLSFLDSKDEYNRDHLQKRMLFVRDNPIVDYLYGGIADIGNNIEEDNNDSGVNNSKYLEYSNNNSKIVIPESFEAISTFVKRQTFTIMGGFSTKDGNYGDLLKNAKASHFYALKCPYKTYKVNKQYKIQNIKRIANI